MGDKPQPNLVTNAWVTYRQHYKPLLAVSFALTMVLIVSSVLALVFPFSLIITLPFVIIPFCFAFIVAITQLMANHPLAINDFYRYLLPGLNPFIRRLMRPFMMLIKASLLSLLMMFLVTFLANLLAPTLNAPLAATFDNLANLTLTTSDANDLLLFLDENNAVLQPFLTIMMLISSASFFLSIFIGLGNKLPALFLLVTLPTAFPELERLHRDIIKSKRQIIFRLRLKHQWPTYLALISGYTLGAILGFVFSQSALVTTLFALLGGLLTLALFLPHYFIGNAIIYQELEPDYYQRAQTAMRKFLTELDSIEELTPAQRQEIRQALEKHLKPLTASEDDLSDVDQPPTKDE